MIFVDPKLWAVATDKPLGDYAVGGIVKLNENGSPVDYLVVHQGLPSSMYDASCDGTWLLRKNIVEKRAWDSGDSNVLVAPVEQIKVGLTAYSVSFLCCLAMR